MSRTILGAGGFRWTPLLLGSKLKLWVDERGQSGTGVLDTWANQAPGGIANLTGSGASRPALGRTIRGYSAPAWVSSDTLGSVTNAASMISASAYELWCVIDQTEVPSGTSTGTSFWLNGMILGDAAHYFGLHVRSEGGGLYTIQLGHFGGAGGVCIVTGVRLDESPTFIHGWYESGDIHLEVNGVAGTPVTVSAVATGSLGLVGMGTGGAGFFTGRTVTALVCNAACSAIERARTDAYLATKYGGRYRLFAATQANMWGNGWADQVPAFRSSSAMLVLDTDSPIVGVRANSTASAVAGYGDAAIIRGAASSRYGAVEEFQLPAQPGLTWDSGPKTVGGSSTRRVFLVGGCLSGFQGTTIEHGYVPIAYAGSTSVPALPASGTCAIDGWGSMGAIEASDGFVVTAGVLSAVAGDVTKRAAYRTRIAAYSADECLICLGTNDGAAGRTSADFTVALGARVDEIVGAGIAAADITIWSPIKRGPSLVGEPAWMADYRTAAQGVAAAKGTGYRDGGTLPALYSSLGPDQVHPDPGAPEQELATAIASDRGTTGKLLLVGDSILCGSTDPSDWNTARGVLALVRIARI